MLKKIVALLTLLNCLNSQTFAALNFNMKEEIKELSNIAKISPKIHQNNLPTPYKELLTQPLMTKAIAQYYQRTPIIKTLLAVKNQGNNSYSRTIIMLIDKNKMRDNAKLALKKREARVVELAFITINFNALPEKMISDIRHTDVPFGSLLSRYNIKIDTTGRSYFSTQCQEKLAALMHCNLKAKIYGRTNTIIRADNKEWIAHVVEVLSVI